MSQIKFKASTSMGIPVEVMAGWDHPQRDFYLTLFDLREDAEEETIWSSIEDASKWDTLGTGRLQAKLHEMGIEAPPGFWERVGRQERNVIHVFRDGAWVQS